MDDNYKAARSLDLSFERLIFEGGVSLYKTEKGFSTHLNSKGGPITVDPAHLANAGLRPLLAILRLPAGVPLTLLLDTNGRGVKRFSAMGLFERHGFHAFSLDYLSNALAYHLEALARNYESARDRFQEVSLIPGAELSDEVNFSYQPEPYFEFDAVITAARRAYDSCRYLLWRIWGPAKSSVPSSFSRTIPLCRKLDPAVRDNLISSWDRYGRRLTDYRDCIQHYVPVDFGLATMFMKQVIPRVWSASARIPDNPEARSKPAFRFTRHLDALSFAWEVAIEVHRVMDLVLQQGYGETGAAQPAAAADR
jgi:hypothetical protein